MGDATPTGDQIYEHYYSALSWLDDNDEAIKAASAFRNLHVIAQMLARWHIPLGTTSLDVWLNTIDAHVPHEEVKERARWVLDSSVGDLLRLPTVSEGYREALIRAPVLSRTIIYGSIPDPSPLLHRNEISRPWNIFVRRLIKNCVAFDEMLQEYVEGTYELRALLFHGYLLASALHHILSIVDYARSWRSGDTSRQDVSRL